MQGAAVHVNPEAPGIQGEALEDLVVRVQEAYDRLERIKRKRPQEITEPLLRLPRVTAEMLRDETSMQTWSEQYVELLSLGDGAS